MSWSKLVITPQLMDVILQVTDAVNNMLEKMGAGKAPTEAASALLQTLEMIVSEEGFEPAPDSVVMPDRAPESC